MTHLSNDDVTKLRQTALEALTQSTTAPQLEAWRVQYLGRKGLLSQLLRQVKDVPAARRREIGQAANKLHQELTQAFAQSVSQVKVEQPTARTASSSKRAKIMGKKSSGHLHPLTLTIRKIQTIFSELGFTTVEGPLVEEPRFNFDLLNISPEHPARAETDTFYLINQALLRTHVSTLQIRGVLENNLKPPFKMFYSGRTFRAERTDATHETTFHQFEFMAVDTTISLADLKGIVEVFYSKFFGSEVTIRFRPAFFPFVEPGVEVDLHCIFCEGKGCRVCKHTGWIEMAGAGMVHPQVLKNINVDPQKYQGIALGGAVDRLAMLQYGIDDIRLFWSGDMRFLKQFS